jgi:hypothetical protein
MTQSKFTQLVRAMIVLCGGIFGGCGIICVSSDCDSKTDFVKYKTFAFFRTSERSIPSRDGDLIFNAIDNEMFHRGYRRTLDSGDLIITISTRQPELQAKSAADERKVITFQNEIRNDEKRYPNGTLFISVFDFRKRKLVWQGRGTEALNDKSAMADHEANVNYAVNMILRNYPVKSKRAAFKTR